MSTGVGLAIKGRLCFRKAGRSKMVRIGGRWLETQERLVGNPAERYITKNRQRKSKKTSTKREDCAMVRKNTALKRILRVINPQRLILLAHGINLSEEITLASPTFWNRLPSGVYPQGKRRRQTNNVTRDMALPFSAAPGCLSGHIHRYHPVEMVQL